MTDSPDRFNGHMPARSAPGAAPSIAAELVDDYGGEPGQAAGKRVSARLFWRAFRRHWWVAILLWTIGSAGLLVLAYSKVRPTYDAFARIRIDQGDQALFRAGSGNTGFAEFKETQAMLITSPIVLGSALTMHPELYNMPMLRGVEDAEAEIRQALTVQIVPKTNLIQITMSSHIPTEAATIVNAVVDAYLRNARAINDDETERRIKRLKETLEERKQAVTTRRGALKALTEKVGSADTTNVKDRNHISVDNYRSYSIRLTDIEIKRYAAQARLDMLRNDRITPGRGPDPEQIEMAVREAFYNDSRVAMLQAQREKAVDRLESAQRLSKKKSDTTLIRYQREIVNTTERIDALWGSLEPSLRRRVLSGAVNGAAAPGAAPDSIERQITEAELQLTALKAEEDSLNGKLEKMNIESQGKGTDALALEFARSDMARAETVLDTVQASLDQAEFDAKNPIARIDLEFRAKPTTRPNSNHRTKAMAAAPLAMGMAVMGLLVLLELRGGRVADPDDLPSRVRLQVLGVVPPLPQIRSSTGGALATRDFRAQRQLDEFVQSLDHLRVALCAHPDPWGRDRHCILITSACGSEGKTTLAAQLAERCVNAGLMTLLIDADLRNPTLSRMLDAESKPGLINVLRDEVAPEDAMIVVGDAGGFHFLPAGTPRIDPSRLLQGDRLGKLLAQARESFDMIIVDAPPVLPVPDALTIGRWTDGAVLAVRYDTSRFPLVERANRRLAHVGVPVIGAVVNGVRGMESAYGYGGYYAYGSTESSAVAEG